MLLNNLSVRDGCKVSFDSEAATAPPTPEPSREQIFRSEGEGETSGNETGDGGGSDGGDDSQGKQAGSVEEGGEGRGGGGEESTEGVAKEGADEVAVVKANGGMVDVSQLRSTLFGMCTDLSVSILGSLDYEYCMKAFFMEGGQIWSSGALSMYRIYWVDRSIGCSVLLSYQICILVYVCTWRPVVGCREFLVAVVVACADAASASDVGSADHPPDVNAFIVACEEMIMLFIGSSAMVLPV